jgi:hypothetical protein
MHMLKTRKKIDKEAKKITDLDFKQKQIASFESNAGYQTYRTKYFEQYLQGRETRTTDNKAYYDIIQPIHSLNKFRIEQQQMDFLQSIQLPTKILVVQEQD